MVYFSCLNKETTDLFAEKPKLLPFTFPAEVQAGQLLQVSCTVLSGDDPMSLKWYKDNQPLLPSSKFIINNVVARMSQLILQDVGSEHSGSYTCHASSSIGEAAVSDVLKVKGMVFEGDLLYKFYLVAFFITMSYIIPDSFISKTISLRQRF